MTKTVVEAYIDKHKQLIILLSGFSGSGKTVLGKSLSKDFNTINLDEIQYIDIIKYLDRDVMDPSKPIGFIRELNKNLSIRTGKYGDYIFYKTPKMKQPKFFKLNGFSEDYKNCDLNVLIKWIKETNNLK